MSNNDATTKLLHKLQTGEISLEECQKELRDKSIQAKTVTYKCSTKGCISFYGIRRMPISLYRGELEAILSAVLDLEDEEPPYKEEFAEFLQKHVDKLSVKEK